MRRVKVGCVEIVYFARLQLRCIVAHQYLQSGCGQLVLGTDDVHVALIALHTAVVWMQQSAAHAEGINVFTAV